MDGEIDPESVAALIDDGADVRVVDIRSEESFARGHIPDSENVPFQRLPDEIDRLSGADRIVTVCPHGEASVQAARLIESYEGTAEATVESMAGGLEAWSGDLDVANGNEGDGGDVDGNDGDAGDVDGGDTAAGESEEPEAPF